MWKVGIPILKVRAVEVYIIFFSGNSLINISLDKVAQNLIVEIITDRAREPS